MPRRSRSRARSKGGVKIPSCPACGWTPKDMKELKEHVVRQWTLTNVSFSGKVTVTVMGVVQCPKCGHRFRVVLSKMKLEASGKSPKERVIEVIRDRKRISLKELSEITKFSERALRIALESYVKEGKLKGHFEEDTFILDE